MKIIEKQKQEETNMKSQSPPTGMSVYLMSGIKLLTGILVFLVMSGATATELAASEREHGLVGLRPLPRTAKQDHSHKHGGSWKGTPTYEEQKGNYPFVAEHLDVVKGWLDGDFKTKRMFFEYYWGSSQMLKRRC